MRHRVRRPSGQFLRRSARGSHRGAARSKRLSLHLERLEPRMMMNGDNDPTPLEDPIVEQPDSDTIQVQPIMTLPVLTIDRRGLVATPIVIGDVWYPSYWRSKPLPTPTETLATEEDLRAWLIEVIDAEYGEQFGKETSLGVWPWYWNSIINVDLARVSTMGDTAAVSFSAAANVSDTNVQVEGVDEADLIETDGDYVYLVSGDELIIVDARDPQNLSIASRVELADTPTGIYLTGDRLTLVSSTGSSRAAPGIVPFLLWDSEADWNADLEAPKTTVTVLDLSDRTAPTQVQRTELRGALVSSRMVDGELRLVLNQRPIHLPQLKTMPSGSDESDNTSNTYETRDQYLERVLDDLVDSMLGTYRTFAADGSVIDELRLVDPQDIEFGDSVQGFHRTTIATFDVLSDEAGPVATKSLFTGGVVEVYSTAENLYVFAPVGGYGSETSIWKFTFDSEDHSIHRAAKGQVEGRLLNQFAADEHEGYLRVVTTGQWWNSGQGLTVLKEDGDQLEVVGSVDGLAPDETLYSVRFMGDKAFAVTFRRVDPLFAIDLSDPTNPQVMGELKIPGYSDYLQPIDENHLLGIGRGAEEERGLFAEMQISIFEVSDLTDPQLIHRYSFEGGRSTASIVTGDRWVLGDGDHHALGFYPSAEILAIPIFNAGTDFVWWATDEETPLFEPGEGGLQVFSIDVDTGFTPTTLIEHDSPILRSLQIGDALLAFSEGEITSHDITNPANQWDSLELLVGSDVALTEITDYVPAAPVLTFAQGSFPAEIVSTGFESLTANGWLGVLTEIGATARESVVVLDEAALGEVLSEADPIDRALTALGSEPVELALASAVEEYEPLFDESAGLEAAIDAVFATAQF